MIQTAVPQTADSTPSSAAAPKSRIRFKRLVKPAPDTFSSNDALNHYERRLAFECDPSDVHHDLDKGVADFVIVDVRQAEAYRACRIPGARHLHNGAIRPSTTRDFDPNTLIITYCWGPGCNGSTKAAAKFAALGFKVKEMIGGIEYWRREGYAVEGTQGDAAPMCGW